MSTNIEQRVDKLESFAADVREFTKFIRDMIRRHDERLDEVRAEQSNADVRLAALADAQIHTEAAQANADTKIAALADAQIKTEDALQRLIARVDKLTDALAQHTADGHGGHP